MVVTPPELRALATVHLFSTLFFSSIEFFSLQLLAMDVSAQVTMKDAAKCDRRCEWQNSANQENAERILRFQVNPGSMSGWGHLYHNVTKNAISVAIWLTFLCVSDVKSVDASKEVQFASKFPLGATSVKLAGTGGWKCFRATEKEIFLYLHQLRQGYPLNLSI